MCVLVVVVVFFCVCMFVSSYFNLKGNVNDAYYIMIK